MRTYSAQAQDPLQAGRELETEAGLEGHVVIRADRVRVTARLLEVASGAALWSGSFEEPLDQFFAAQDALAGQVVSAMQIELMLVIGSSCSIVRRMTSAPGRRN